MLEKNRETYPGESDQDYKRVSKFYSLRNECRDWIYLVSWKDFGQTYFKSLESSYETKAVVFCVGSSRTQNYDQQIKVNGR